MLGGPGQAVSLGSYEEIYRAVLVERYFLNLLEDGELLNPDLPGLKELRTALASKKAVYLIAPHLKSLDDRPSGVKVIKHRRHAVVHAFDTQSTVFFVQLSSEAIVYRPKKGVRGFRVQYLGREIQGQSGAPPSRWSDIRSFCILGQGSKLTLYTRQLRQAPRPPHPDDVP